MPSLPKRFWQLDVLRREQREHEVRRIRNWHIRNWLSQFRLLREGVLHFLVTRDKGQRITLL